MKIGKYFYEKSTRDSKKLMVKVDGKTIHFGDSKMEQFKDKTKIWKSRDHGDVKRQKNKEGKLTWKDPKNANYHSIKILWDG